LGAEGLATEVALERLLARVCAQVHVEIGFLGEGMTAELTHVRPLIPVQVRTQQRLSLTEVAPFHPVIAGGIPSRRAWVMPGKEYHLQVTDKKSGAGSHSN
jgi:hypothetical protein